MKTKNLIATAILSFCLFGSKVGFAQSELPNRNWGDKKGVKVLNLSGPRVGLTLVTGEDKNRLKNKFDANPLIVQFGYQFEKRFFSTNNGVTALTEFIPLVGGLDQSLLIPSVSWLLGIRTASGFEFAFGPNLTMKDKSVKDIKPAFVFATGYSLKMDGMYFPFNFAVSRSRDGLHYNFTTGFNL